MTGDRPSNALRLGRRAVEGLAGAKLLQDFCAVEGEPSWVLKYQLRNPTSSFELVPESTDWYVLVDPAYPLGAIEFHPAKENSLHRTFPHQAYNDEGDAKFPWRTGNICLSTPLKVLGREEWAGEPLDAATRLRWHMQRALEWISAAAAGELLRSGEPFELPAFPSRSKELKMLAFCESDETFRDWSQSSDTSGIFSFKKLKTNGLVAVVTSFKSSDRKILGEAKWGRAIVLDPASESSGIWLKVSGIPVLAPWHAPKCWSELRTVFSGQNLNLDNQLRPLMPILRQNGGPRLIALGFPIPKIVGGAPERIHWQCFEVPGLCDGHSQVKGFPKNERGFWNFDRNVAMQGARPLHWVESQNWADEQIRTRGALPNSVLSQKFLLIGAGALGSMVAELLVRAGVQRLTILDKDSLSVGNLARHTLTITDISLAKAEQLAKRLNFTSPHAQVDGIVDEFPPRTALGKSRAEESEAIIDCTGNDTLLVDLGNAEYASPKWFFSISVGFGAKKLFLFASHGGRFPASEFREEINPWLIDELNNYAEGQLPREGIGCWHPVFPARVEDMWMFATLAVKELTRFMYSGEAQGKLAVFGQESDDNGITKIARMEAMHA